MKLTNILTTVVLGGFLVVSSGIALGADDTFDVSITARTELSFSATDDLSFAATDIPASGSTVVTTGTTDANAANFTISGSDLGITISVADSTTLSNGTDNITVNNYQLRVDGADVTETAGPGSTSYSATISGGTMSVDIGADATVATGISEGSYTGTNTLTVTYQ